MSYWIILLFIIGIMLLLVEFFVPGFGVFGISGIFLCGIATIMIACSYGPAAVLAAVVVMALIIVLIIRFLKSRKILDKIVLRDTLSAQGFDESEISDLVGKSGTAATTLRPYGKADLDGVLVDVFSNGDYIEKGKPIRVISVKGKNVIVMEVKQ